MDEGENGLNDHDDLGGVVVGLVGGVLGGWSKAP